MKRARNLNIVGLILNIAIIALMAVGIASYTKGFDISELKHFAILTTFVTAFSSLLMIIPNIINIKHNEIRTPKLFFSLRFLSAVMSAISLIAVLAFICPKEQDGFKSLFSTTDGTIYFFFIIPAISVLMFMFIETGKKERFASTFIPLALVTIYAVSIIIATAVIKSKDGAAAAAKFVPNFFFIFDKTVLAEFVKQNPKFDGLNLHSCVLFGLIVYVSTYVSSLILFSVNRLTYAIGVGQEYKDEAALAKEAKELEKEKQAKANMTIGEKISHFVKDEVSFNPETKYTQLDHIYHISYHDRKLKTWKVKSENAGRALKVFKNQKEAIEYAKGQVKLHGGSIRVHSIKGAIRKKGNWDTIDK